MNYFDLAIKRQALLERVKSGQVRDYVAELKKLEALIRSTLLGLEDEVSTLSQTRLNRLLSQLRTDQGVVFSTASTAFLDDAAKIATVTAAQEVLDLTATITGPKIEAPKAGLFQRVIQRPMTATGELLEPWIKRFSETENNRINNTIRAGWSQGRTNKQLVAQIIGTRGKRYKDGILETTRRNASTVVRTSVQHVASTARQETWQANPDVVERYQWVSTLDTVTSKQCRSLDGQKFDFGKGPVPPIHPNCRSTTIPAVSKEFDFLAKGRTRSAEDGPTTADTSYYDWLKRQDEATQIQVLGRERAKLFRDGGLSAERFRTLQLDKNFEPLTLDEMKAIEPEAFKRAGL